jgi:hypothetical protein
VNTSSCFIIICLFLSITGCTTQPRYSIVYTNDSVVEWKSLKLAECRDQSIIITLTTFDMRLQSGEVMTEGQVIGLQKWLVDQCAMYYKLSI